MAIKVNIKTIPRKEFEKQYGKYAGAMVGKGNGYTIELKGGYGKTNTKKILQHEMGHIFYDTQQLGKKIPQYDKRKLRKGMVDERIKYYKQRGVKSGKAIMQEGLADVYYYIKYGQPHEKQLFKEHHPGVYNVIKQQLKKFKPEVTRI